MALSAQGAQWAVLPDLGAANRAIPAMETPLQSHLGREANSKSHLLLSVASSAAGPGSLAREPEQL